MWSSSSNGVASTLSSIDERGTRQLLARAILQAVAYSDVFDYPLTADEIHRYMVGVRADRSLVDVVLANGALPSNALSCFDGYWMLSGKEHLVEVRRQRASRSSILWREAIRAGRVISRMPFIRMVAITGELAVDNTRSGSDIDLFVVTEPGRLWIARAMIIAVVKVASRRGIELCPNYLITENALNIDTRNLYTAREIAQMVPLFGLDVYERIRKANPWTCDYLPNATGPPRMSDLVNGTSRIQPISERLLRTGIGDRLESWEMNRKIQKFTREVPGGGEVAFSSDWCKGHFDAHGEKTLAAYAERLRHVEGLLQ
jgi:hypothetical protein